MSKRIIDFNQRGDFSKFTKYLERLKNVVKIGDLDKYGKEGVQALKESTPKDSGDTAESWYYKINKKNEVISISFFNSNIQNGVPIAIILQYGHGTRNGGWVEGRDFINPSIQPIFDKIANEAWKEVTNL